MSDKNRPVVGILMGSASDKEKMRGSADALKRFGVEYEVAVLSAHRVPDKVISFVRGARERGLKVLIAGAGWAAHLAGAVAANTTLPVIGVPLSGSPMGGEDALLATVMMPKGIPVATVGVDNSFNAGLLAIQILSISDTNLTVKLDEHRHEQAEAIDRANTEIDL